MKKLFKNFYFIFIFFSLIVLILYGSLLRHHYLNGKQFKNLQNLAVIFAEFPSNVKKIITNKSFNFNKMPVLYRHKNKNKFTRYLNIKRDALLILPIYDHDLNRSIVEIIDLNNFKTIHRYEHDIKKMNKQVRNFEQFKSLNIDDAPSRFEYRNPLLLSDGSLISHSEYSPIFKIDFCSKLEWMNDEERFHHSINFNSSKNEILTIADIKPYSEYIQKYSLPNYTDDSIVLLSLEGEILYIKSITEILIENKFFPENQADIFNTLHTLDPIHANDIEPALSDSEYWNKGDLFISSRHLSAIIHYRPSTNEVINYIIGPFNTQHDIDIISDEEISIFNNNNFVKSRGYSEILIYNFKKNNFEKKFNEMLINEEFKTETQGLSHTFKDGALMIEEQNHGRIILFNKDGEKSGNLLTKTVRGILAIFIGVES